MVTSLALSGDGKRAASGGYDKVVSLWEVESGKLVRPTAELAWQTTIPLAGDESVGSAHDAERAILLGAFRLTGIKLSKVGGIPEAMKISCGASIASIGT